MVLHNAYRIRGGEDIAVEKQIDLLRRCGHDVLSYWRQSAELSQLRLARLQAAMAGVIAPRSRAVVCRLLKQHSPAIAHVHNLFPLISPSVLPEFRKQGVPVVMTVHNYRLICPNGLHMSKHTRTVCDRCCRGREYWCVLRNCEVDIFKSIGYALRNWVARQLSYFLDTIAVYGCMTEFQRQRLIDEGFPADRITVIANAVESACATMDANTAGAYVGYVGRLSPEKGIDTLCAAAGRLQNIPFQIVGPRDSATLLPGRIPRNLRLLGSIDRTEVPSFTLGSRFMVLCSLWYEGFPMALVEAMMAGKAVVASRIGGIPEIVDENVTGLLAKPGNAEDLADKIQYLWDRPSLCRQMGQAAREKAIREYSPKKHYERLMAMYETAIKLGPPQCHHRWSGRR